MGPFTDDVLEQTLPEDDCPPDDEFLTGICNVPARTPAHGSTSDAVIDSMASV